MRSDPPRGLLRRMFVRAAVLALGLPMLAWLFLAGLGALPNLGDPANIFLRAAYVVAWALCSVSAWPG